MVIIVYFEENQEEHLLSVLYSHKRALGLNVADIKGMNSLICTHCIALEYYGKPIRQMHYRLNPTMKEG